MFIKRVLLFLLLTTIAFAQGFEGFVKFKIEGSGETTFLNYFKQGEKIRMEPELQDQQMGGSILFMEGKTYVLMPEQKMYMELGDQMKKMQEMMGQKVEENEKEIVKPTKTGETKEILGYETEKWIMEDDGITTELWAAKGLGDFTMLSMPMSDRDMPDWYDDITEGGFFPMLVVSKAADGSIDSRMEVVDIQEKSLSSDMFEIPGDYSKMSIPGMGDY